MKKLALFLLIAGSALANQRAQGNCELGGNVVVTAGLNSTTFVQQSFPRCTVTVYLTGTTTPVTIYSDNSNTPLANPFTADVNGHWYWYAVNGRYDVKLSGAGIPGSGFTLGDILLADPASGSTVVTSFGPSGNARTGAVVPETNDYTYAQIGGTRQGTSTVPQMAGAISGGAGTALCLDGSGNDTTTGCGALAPSTAGYNFPAQTCNSSLICSAGGTSGGSLIIGANALVMTPVPPGVNGTDSAHGIYVSGGSGTAEACLITGGSGTGGSSSGTIIITCANTHTGAWTVQSVASGIPEALQAGGAGAAYTVPQGTIPVYGLVTSPYASQALICSGRAATILQMSAAANLPGILLINQPGWTVASCGFDGNFINESSGGNSLLKILNVSNVHVSECMFTHSGVGFPGASSAAGLLIDAATDLVIKGNQFTSNWGYDLAFFTRDTTGTLYNGYDISDNEFGSPSISESNAQVNYWDTGSAAQYSLVVDGYSNIRVANNSFFGAVKKNFLGNPIAMANSKNVTIVDNLVDGLGNSTGTIAVTNGSGTITGTNTFWNTGGPSAGDVGAFMFLEGDTTMYQITVVTSSTQVTVTPVVARASASGLRYQISSTGDGIGCGGCTNVTIVGNVVRHSHDNGIDVTSDGLFGSLNISKYYTVAGNTSIFNNGVGMYVGGVTDATITGNSLSNNGQAGSAIVAQNRAGLFIDNSSALAIVARSIFSGNVMNDTQTTHSQQYGLSINGTQGTGNYLAQNNSSGNAVGDFYASATNVLASAFGISSFGGNTGAPPASPFFIYGPNCVAASCQGDFGIFGTDLSHMVAFGYDTTNGYGWIQSANKGTGLTPLVLNPSGGSNGLGKPIAFASLGACGAAQEGYVEPVNDSNTLVFNAVIAGGGTGHGLAYCNGTAWVFH